MHDSSVGLGPEEAALVARVVRSTLGEGAQALSVEMVWERPHLLRVATSKGTVIVKRAKRGRDQVPDDDSLRAEAAALSVCDAMPVAVAPRLLGFDAADGLLVMEDLPPGQALSDLLLLGDAASAVAGLAAVATSLATLHHWTAEREGAFVARATEFGVRPQVWPSWVERAESARRAFLDAARALAVSTAGLDDELDRAFECLYDSPRRGLVHGDLCPDNVRIAAGAARIFDFEGSAFGPCALDVAFLLAPFPGCWCFADLPAPASVAALGAYESTAAALGVELGGHWRTELAAARACYVVVRAAQFDEVDAADEEWGTTTMRPRLITWLANFAEDDDARDALPALSDASGAMSAALAARWPTAAPSRYPAFAGAEDEVVAIPQFWRPGL